MKLTPTHARRRFFWVYLPVLVVAGLLFDLRATPVDGLGGLWLMVMLTAAAVAIIDLVVADRRAP